MSDFLETTFDKFTFRVAKDRLYCSDGLWVFWVQECPNNRVRIGMTDFLQQRSGDAAFVTVKPVGTELNAGDDFASLETVKVDVSLPSPLSGRIVAINEELEMSPELVNQSPYDKGWMAEIEAVDWAKEKTALLDAAAYFDVMKVQVAEEAKS